MLTIEQFILHIEEAIEEIEPGTLKPETEFRKMETWSSMHALIILAMIDTNYDVTLAGEDMRNCNTVQEIYAIILAKRA